MNPCRKIPDFVLDPFILGSCSGFLQYLEDGITQSKYCKKNKYISNIFYNICNNMIVQFVSKLCGLTQEYIDHLKLAKAKI